MKSDRSSYCGYRFPAEIISYAVWAYHRFCLSFRDVEDLLAERGIIVSYETIRQWCQKFGLDYARKLKRREGRLGDLWYLDEVFIRINGQQQYLWRAVDQDGDVIDILVQPHRDQRAAVRFFRKLLRGQSAEPIAILMLTECRIKGWFAVANRSRASSICFCFFRRHLGEVGIRSCEHANIDALG
jgi:putative transposase